MFGVRIIFFGWGISKGGKVQVTKTTVVLEIEGTLAYFISH